MPIPGYLIDTTIHGEVVSTTVETADLDAEYFAAEILNAGNGQGIPTDDLFILINPGATDPDATAPINGEIRVPYGAVVVRIRNLDPTTDTAVIKLTCASVDTTFSVHALKEAT